MCYKSNQVEQEIYTVLFYFGCARLVTCHPEKENKTYIFLSITATVQFIFLRLKNGLFHVHEAENIIIIASIIVASYFKKWVINSSKLFHHPVI